VMKTLSFFRHVAIEISRLLSCHTHPSSVTFGRLRPSHHREYLCWSLEKHKMGQLKQITRNATFAWSPARGKPFIASGTIAGAVDASFSQDSELEIWDLDLDNTDTNAFELIQPTAKITTERKYLSPIHLPFPYTVF